MPTAKPTVNLTRVWADQAAGPDVVDPGDTKYSDGWVTELPPHSTFNFLQKLFTQYIAYQNENGVSAWDVLVEYPIGGMVKGTDGNLYISQLVQTGNDPLGGDGVNWRSFSGADGLFYYPEQLVSMDMTTNGQVSFTGGSDINYGNSELIVGDGFVQMKADGNKLFEVTPSLSRMISPNGSNTLETNDSGVIIESNDGDLSFNAPNNNIVNEITTGNRFRVRRDNSDLMVIDDVHSRLTHPVNCNMRAGDNSQITVTATSCTMTAATSCAFLVQGVITLSVINQGVILSKNNVTRLETTTSGVDVTGDLNTTGSTCGPSDKRLKEKVKSLDKWESLDVISKLRPVEFEWNEGARRILGSPEGIQRGLIAQEVEKVIPDIVKEVPSKLLGTHKVLAHGSDTALMMSAIQALNSKMEVLSDENKQLRAMIKRTEGLFKG